MNVKIGRAAKAVVTGAARALGLVEDVAARRAEAQRSRDAAEVAYREALGAAELDRDEKSEARVFALRKELDDAQEVFDRLDAAHAQAEKRKAEAEASDAAAALDASWATSAKIAAARSEELRTFVAACREIEASYQRLLKVNAELSQTSPRRLGDRDTRSDLNDQEQRNRCKRILISVAPSLLRELVPGVMFHPAGAEGVIQNELLMSAKFGDRNFGKGN